MSLTQIKNICSRNALTKRGSGDQGPIPGSYWLYAYVIGVDEVTKGGEDGNGININK